MFEQRRPPASESVDIYAELGSRYVRALAEGRRQDALRLLVGAVEQGRDAAVLLERVVEPAADRLATLRRTQEVHASSDRDLEAVEILARALLQPPIFDDLPVR